MFTWHLAIVHGKREDGTDADATTVARFSEYAKRGPRKPAQSTPSADAAGTPQLTTSGVRPTISDATPSAMTRRRRRQLKSVAIVIGLALPQPTTMMTDVAEPTSVQSRFNRRFA